MVHVSDTPAKGIDKIIDELLYSEISDKDLVIPKDKLYNYVVVLEKVRSVMSAPAKIGRE